MLGGDILMVVSFLVLFAIPMYEMWIKKEPFTARGES